MGLIFSRFRRKKTTEQILEDIQSDIQSLESNRELTLQRQNYVVGRLIIYSVVIYIIAALVFYFCFFPVSLADRIFYMIPLLVFPIIVVLLKKFITWYYKREIVHSKDKLSDLKVKKKKILEDVMNKETYKVAKEILERFAPEHLRKPGEVLPRPALAPAASTPENEVRMPVPPPQATKGPGPPALLAAPPGPSAGNRGRVEMDTPPKYQGPMVLQRQPSPQRRLVRPIIPRERNFIDKIIESLVGDGPSNRYALICRNCASHNGMALKEEFEYLAFRCAYCGFPNPAHKVRPRPSVQLNRERAPSEDRRSIDGGGENRIQTDDDDKSTDGERKDGESVNGSESNRVEGIKTVGLSNSEEDKTTEPASVSQNEEDNSAPTDGIRPRKPLHLIDD